MLVALADRVALVPCSKGCGGMRLIDKTNPNRGIEYNEKLLCSRCLIAEFEKEDAKEEAKERRRLAAAKKKGFKYQTIMMVHGNGDDYEVELLTTEKPMTAEIEKILKKRHSTVLNDWTINSL